MTETQRNPLKLAAQIISDVFSPIVLPSYVMAAAMWLTPLVIIGERVRIIATAVVVVLTAMLPVAAILLLMRLGRVSDMSISNRNQRLIPYGISILCYAAAATYLYLIHAPSWLYAFYIGAGLTSLIAAVVNLQWKISAHGSAVAGFATAMFWMAAHRLILYGAIWWVIAVILICGLVGTSRLILNRHTPGQVFAGYALGAFVVWMVLTFSI